MIDNPSENDYLFAEAKLGIEVDNFLQTDIGRYLKGRAQQEVDEAVNVFLNCDPERSRELIMKAKAKARAAQQVMTWLTEAYNDGMGAVVQLEELGD